MGRLFSCSCTTHRSRCTLVGSFTAWYLEEGPWSKCSAHVSRIPLFGPKHTEGDTIVCSRFAAHVSEDRLPIAKTVNSNILCIKNVSYVTLHVRRHSICSTPVRTSLVSPLGFPTGVLVVMCITLHFAVSHPRPPPRREHVCTVGVLPGPPTCDLVSKVRQDQSANSCVLASCCVGVWLSCGLVECLVYVCIFTPFSIELFSGRWTEVDRRQSNAIFRTLLMSSASSSPVLFCMSTAPTTFCSSRSSPSA